MNYKGHFTKKTVKPWYKLKNGYVCGQAFLNEELLKEDTWGQALNNITTISDAQKLVSLLNGWFALVLELEDKLFLAVDRQRSIPLFYSVNNEIEVFDHLGFLEVNRFNLNKNALLELEHSIFITGKNTCLEGVFQVRAGSFVVIDQQKNCQECYYYNDIPLEDSKPEDEYFKIIDEHFIDTFKRLIKHLNNRRAVIPLSGGHDSRLVLYYLKSLGYNNILTYTYGKKGNFESETSKKVADYLGVEWHFVEYTPKKMKKLFNKEFKDLVNFCFNGVSTVCTQEWLAVKELKEKGILKKDDVIVPGYSFDAIAGEFVLPHYVKFNTALKETLIKDIFNKHYTECNWQFSKNLSVNKNSVLNLIENEFAINNLKTEMTSWEAIALYDNFNYRERQAKYTCNAVKMYEYFGFDWCMPLWDNQLIDFWRTVPLKLKLNRDLFFRFTMYKYPKLMEAAPVLNLKLKTNIAKQKNMVYRVLRKIKQIINYFDFHYCLGYFNRKTFYKIFFKYKFININFYVNYVIINIIKGEKNNG